MSKLEANTIAPATGTTLTLGESGDTVSVVDSISAVSVTATNSTIAGSDLSNAAFLAGDTSTGLGIDSNEVVSKGNNLLLGVIDAGLDIEFREANTERLRFELDSTPTIKGTGDTSLASTTSLSFLTNTSSEVMRVTSGGKIGIGVSDPPKTLTIEYNSSSTDVLTGEGLGGGATGTGVLIENVNTTANSYANLDFRAGTADGRIALDFNATNQGDFHFITDNNGSPATMLFIASGGNVGIGTTSPSAKLNVSGTATFTGTVTGPTTDTLLVKNSAGTTLKTIRGV